jgi:competence protein ComEC
MRLAALAFLAGITWLHQLPELPDARWALLGLAALPVALSGRQKLPILASGLWLVLGASWALFRADLAVSRALPPTLEGKDLVAAGTVASVPVPDARALRFDFAIDDLSLDGHAVPTPGLTRLSWYDHAPALRAGDRWRLTVRLKRPHGFMNPGGFDYEAWLLQQGVRATGYVRPSDDNRRMASSAWSRPVDRMRQGLGSNIAQAVPGGTYVGVLKALAIGERGEISPEQWEVFQRTGTTHLVAISGLHIGLIAAMVFWLARWAWVVPHRLPLRWPAQKAGAVAALFGAAAYAAMAGFSIPTQRALLMLAVALAGLIAGRHVIPTQTLAAALLLVLFWDPLAVLSSGFWLSFAAVAVILYALTARPVRSRAWMRWGRVQWAVTVGLLPLTLFLFHRASLAGLLANLVAIPLVGFLIVPLTLLGTVSSGLAPAAGALLLSAADQGLAWLWTFLQALASIGAAQWEAPQPSVGALAAAIVGVLWLLAPRGVPARWLGAVWLLPLLLPGVMRPASGEMVLTVLDVGQGLAVVVQTRGHVLVYDAGPRYGADFDAGSAVVVPFLRQAGVRKVDLLVLSHGDNDHVGGAESLLRALPVAGVLSGAPALPQGVHGRFCAAGEGWTWDAVAFRVLHPAPGADRGGNDASCVLYVESEHGSILLPGDIGAAAEALLSKAGRLPRATAVAVPHHGSGSSSTALFVGAVHPVWALFSAGYRNRFGFPRPSVLQRYRAVGAQVLNTATEGALIAVFGASGVRVESYRRLARHWWTGR